MCNIFYTSWNEVAKFSKTVFVYIQYMLFVILGMGLMFGSDRCTLVTDCGTLGRSWDFPACFKLPSWTGVDCCRTSQSFSCSKENSWECARYSVRGRRQVCWTVPHAGLQSPGLLQRWWWVGVAPPGRLTMSGHRPGVVFSWVGRVEHLPRYILLSDLDVCVTSKYWGPKGGLIVAVGEHTERGNRKEDSRLKEVLERGNVLHQSSSLLCLKNFIHKKGFFIDYKVIYKL